MTPLLRLRVRSAAGGFLPLLEEQRNMHEQVFVSGM